MEDTEQRIQLATAKFSALLNMWSDSQLSHDLRSASEALLCVDLHSPL